MNFFTELREGLSISWNAIRANKLRSILTTLGIVIGIVTVTLMGTAITGLNNAFLKSISFIGADVLYVDRISWFVTSAKEWREMYKRSAITLEQVDQLEKQMTLARAIAPTASTQESIKYEKRSANGVQIIGTTDEFLATSGATIKEGHFLSTVDSDNGRQVCVIGWQVATNLFPRASALGQKISIDRRPFEVVGVLEPQGTFFGNSLDNQAIIPLAQYMIAFDRSPDLEIRVKVKSVADLDNATAELDSVMRRIRHLAPEDTDDFSVNQQNEFITLFHRVAGTIAVIGVFITGLSLFVGGIGIMNIMFVSVAERTREIGIRKAIGAKRRTILLQFLIEAASICLMGGLIGLGIAWPLTLLVQKVLPATMSPLIVGISLLVSLVTGLLSGIFPAWRAARMNPVDALRNE
jgi:putative ABC transport system permease protein